MQSVFSDHIKIKLDTSNRKISEKPSNIQKLNNIHLNKL